MADTNLERLAALVKQEREVLLANWRSKVRELPSASKLDIPTLNDHIPRLLDDLSVALRANPDLTIAELLAEGGSPAHGLQRAHERYDIEEVVAEYNILRGCVHDLADTNGVVLQGRPFHVINLIFDHAIGLAVQTYATERALEMQRRREEYLAFVAHDLRTPLSAISLAGRVLEISFSGRETTIQVAQMLRALRRNADYLETLVRNVLEENVNVQAETGIKVERREVDLWPLVEALIHDLHPVAGTASTTLVNNVPEDLKVFADAGLLKRVFQNLIANAIQYTPRGEVTIGARPMDAGGTVECWVIDNGAGIPANLLDKVFDKGLTDPQKEDGTGLGLAIVKTFIEAHGGNVTVESKEGVGSTFHFSLPGKKSPPAE
jgi:two-component system phosphate regulon sensor histidine kinase PhoR